MNEQINGLWKTVLKDEFGKGYFIKLRKRVENTYRSSAAFPAYNFIFNAFQQCPFEDIKVVILGQDPYINEGEAQGLSFSVPDDIKIPPSLKNIYKEIKSDLGIDIPQNGNLERWAKQGVLLLNSTLTVEAGKSASHQGWGWERFTDTVIQKVSEEKEHVVFLLWGNYARGKRELIDQKKHLILEASHPSPLAAYRGFFGCKHFSKCNVNLTVHNIKPISW